MPYKDPEKQRESNRIRQARLRERHKNDPVFLANKSKWAKITWARHGKEYNEKHKQWYYENREAQLSRMQQYNQEHREHLNKLKNEQNKLRRKTNPQFLIKSRLRCLIYNSVKLYGKGATVEKSKKYGLSLNESAEHLSKTKPLDFNEKSYHIDHITPVSHFDLTNPEQVKKAFDKSNLQWLPAIENIKKSDKLSVKN
jgi:hypothetical protein